MKTFTDVVLDAQAGDSDGAGSSMIGAQRECAATGDGLGSLDGLADQIIRLVRTWSHLKARMVSNVDPELGTLFLISRLIKDGPTRAKDLAQATCSDQSTVSRQVAALVKAGLIERQADPDDGRASILVPTALGVSRVNDHFANRGRALEQLVEDWSALEREQFVDLLRRFTSSLELRRDEVARAMTHGHEQITDHVRAAREEPLPQTRSTSHGQSTLPHHQHVRPQAGSERSN